MVSRRTIATVILIVTLVSIIEYLANEMRFYNEEQIKRLLEELDKEFKDSSKILEDLNVISIPSGGMRNPKNVNPRKFPRIRIPRILPKGTLKTLRWLIETQRAINKYVPEPVSKVIFYIISNPYLRIPFTIFSGSAVINGGTQTLDFVIKNATVAIKYLTGDTLKKNLTKIREMELSIKVKKEPFPNLHKDLLDPKVSFKEKERISSRAIQDLIDLDGKIEFKKLFKILKSYIQLLLDLFENTKNPFKRQGLSAFINALLEKLRSGKLSARMRSFIIKILKKFNVDIPEGY